MKSSIKKTSADKIFMGTVFALLAIFGILIILPLIWVLLTSVNDFYNYLINPLSFPKDPQFGNYVRAFNGLNISVWDNENARVIDYDIYNMFGYSVIIAAIPAFFGVLTPALLGYATAKYDFWGKDLLISINLLVMTLPIYGNLPSKLVMYKAFGLYDNLAMLLIGHTGFGMAFLIYRGSFKSMPNEYREAASIDGAGQLTIMAIYFRLLMPLFAAYFMLGFVGAWNDYMTNVIWLPSYPNLAYGIYVFESYATIQGFTVPETLAGFVIVAIPAILLWTISQKFVGDRIVAGSLKG